MSEGRRLFVGRLQSADFLVVLFYGLEDILTEGLFLVEFAKKVIFDLDLHVTFLNFHIVLFRDLSKGKINEWKWMGGGVPLLIRADDPPFKFEFAN